MKKVFAFAAGVLLFFACNNKEKQQENEGSGSAYQYIEIRQEQSFTGEAGPVTETEPQSIHAAHDSLAYLEAFKLFILSNAENVRNIESGSLTFNFPIDFKLLDPTGKDIAKTVTFATKQAKENEIFDEYIGE
ncbi:MAG: hypothetical protein LUG18_15715 [Candidatus Azobacteroides sp.]|nr:hypothetical protein [Candidatus Azobacteroides sp.]